jgi:hypothetical protein
VEQCRKTKDKSRLQLGGMVAVFGFAVLSTWLCLPNNKVRPDNVGFTFSLLLAFATFLSGKALMLLSMDMLGRLENLVSVGHRVVSKFLIVVCRVLPVMTLVSLLSLLPSMLYLCLGLAVVTTAVLPVVAAYYCLPRRAEGADEAAAYEEHKEEVDAASKIISFVTNSAFGGLVGVLFSASESKQGFGATAAIFFMFFTAIFGMLLMTVSKEVLKVTKRRLRQFLVANAFLLCSLACAAFAASFNVIGCQVFASFAPLAITGVIYFTLQHRAVRCGDADPRSLENEEARLKATEDMATKVAAATMGATMTVLGCSVGESRGEKTVATDLTMVVLTSMFVSSFGFMFLTAVPNYSKACLSPISKLLIWSSVAFFAAAAVSVYGAEVFRGSQPLMA